MNSGAAPNVRDSEIGCRNLPLMWDEQIPVSEACERTGGQMRNFMEAVRYQKEGDDI